MKLPQWFTSKVIGRMREMAGDEVLNPSIDPV